MPGRGRRCAGCGGREIREEFEDMLHDVKRESLERTHVHSLWPIMLSQYESGFFFLFWVASNIFVDDRVIIMVEDIIYIGSCCLGNKVIVL